MNQTQAPQIVDHLQTIERLNAVIEQKDSELQQFKDKQRLDDFFIHALLKFSPDLIYFKDLNSRFLRISDALASIMSLNDSSEIIGKRDFDFYDVDRAKSAFDDEQKIIRTGVPVLDKEEHQVFHDGAELSWVSTTKMPLKDLNGTLIGTFGVSRDITLRKRMEEEQKILVSELEAKNTELERFTYTVSHDLKSPLVTIQGFLGILKEDAIDGTEEDLNEDIEEIQKAVEKMKALLDELLELSRIGRIVNPYEEVTWTHIVEEALAQLAGKIDDREVTIKVTADKSLVYGDHQRLIEVVQNLIENALKYSGDQSKPVIEIGTRLLDGKIVFYIKDNGIGIDPKYHSRVFNLFEQLNAEIDGTGIGLAIVKRIVESHDGRIWVESDGVGCGSIFNIRIPSKSEYDEKED